MTNVSIETKSRALKLRAILNQLSNVSYSFARLNKDYPFDSLNERELRHLITAYEELIETAAPLMHRYKGDNVGDTSPSAQTVEVANV